MNNKLANLENDLDKFYQDIKQRISDLKSPENPIKNEFEVVKWYKNGFCYGLFKCIGLGNVGFIRNVWSDNIRMSTASAWTLADPKEIESFLTEEAIRRGFKAGVTVKYPKADWPFLADGLVNTLRSSVFEYSMESDELHDGHYVFYRNGKWAEILKDDIIKICGKKVVIRLMDQEIFIDGKTYCLHELQMLRDIMSAGQVKGLVVGCNGHETIGIDVIDRILSKFNS